MAPEPAPSRADLVGALVRAELRGDARAARIIAGAIDALDVDGEGNWTTGDHPSGRYFALFIAQQNAPAAEKLLPLKYS